MFALETWLNAHNMHLERETGLYSVLSAEMKLLADKILQSERVNQ